MAFTPRGRGGGGDRGGFRGGRGGGTPRGGRGGSRGLTGNVVQLIRDHTNVFQADSAIVVVEAVAGADVERLEGVPEADEEEHEVAEADPVQREVRGR